MRGRWVRAGVVAAMASLVLGAVGVAPAGAAEGEGLVPQSQAGLAVPLARAGRLVTWGHLEPEYGGDSMAVPAAYADLAFSQVLVPSNAVIALTAAGRVVGWGNSYFRTQEIPTAVTQERVVQIAANADGYAAAVTADGRVLVWGPKRTRPTPLNVPAGLTGVKQLAFGGDGSGDMLLALKHDGTVLAWGSSATGATTVPAGLTATAIAMVGPGTATALTTDGRVVQWGASEGQLGRPASVGVSGNVKAIDAGIGGVVAWLADDSLVAWGGGDRAVPDVEPLFLGSSLSRDGSVLVDQDHGVHLWHTSGYDDHALLPAGLDGQPVSQVSLGYQYTSASTAGEQAPAVSAGGVIVTEMLTAGPPRITGTARPGSVLTAVPGTFSADPDSIVGQWRVGGAPVAGNGAQLSLTTAMVGKTITYRSTATKAGETTVSSDSAGVVVASAGPVGSTTTVTKAVVAPKGASLKVAGAVKASRPATGKATVTIVKGKKVIVAKAVPVSASGGLTLKVGGFAKLVAKKLKVKGKKAKTAYRGAYTVRIAYGGNAQVRASSGSKKLTAR